MARYEMQKSCGYYMIHDRKGYGKWGLYLMYCRNGVYHWSSDLTYGKRFSEKTARKHIAILEGRR